MRKKDIDRVRGYVSRRSALQGLGAVVGTGALGCSASPRGGSGGVAGATGDDDSSGSTDPSTDSSGVDGSTSGATGPNSSGDSTDSTGSRESGSSSTGDVVDECVGDGGFTPQELLAGVETVVVVMMENRSFDHYFGSARFVEGWTVNGLEGTETNPDLSGADVAVFPLTNLELADPPHDWAPTHAQWNEGANDGFVRENQRVNPESYRDVMGYYVRDQLPVLYGLADNYTLCDRWFSSVLGPTWPNRFYLHCASAGGQTRNLPQVGLPTIWGVLEDAGIGARNYYSDLLWATGAFLDLTPRYAESIDGFFAAAQAGTLPPFVLVDPNFGLLSRAGANDDHPDHSVAMGQVFLGSIYAALSQSPQWDRCLLVITYDENGGFYDHVSPPETTDELPEFRQLGFRVPAVVVGPHVRRGCVNSTQFEHVSVISTLTEKHNLTPMNQRVSDTHDLSSCINPAYLDDPQPPVRLPAIEATLEQLLADHGGDSHPEMRQLIANGTVRLPPDRQQPDAGRRVALSLIEHAQRLGVLKLRR